MFKLYFLFYLGIVPHVFEKTKCIFSNVFCKFFFTIWTLPLYLHCTQCPKNVYHHWRRKRNHADRWLLKLQIKKSTICYYKLFLEKKSDLLMHLCYKFPYKKMARKSCCCKKGLVKVEHTWSHVNDRRAPNDFSSSS